MKPKLLVMELWGVGDLAIGSPFLRAAGERYEVTLLAKPHAAELQSRFWPQVKVLPLVAPWTAFRGKYRLHRWPWREFANLRRAVQQGQFDIAFSARHDPRDHALLYWLGVKQLLGFARWGSQMLLTESLPLPGPEAHRYAYWQAGARALDIPLSAKEQLVFPRRQPGQLVLVHTGAAQPVRVWPLERYREIVERLRAKGLPVQVLCDAPQEIWWRQNGETNVAVARTLSDLLAWLDQGAVFVGNDSGPGHLAALCGVPTFTLFGPQLPQWFAPLHPAASWMEGADCDYKPCFDSCRYAEPYCLLKLDEPGVWARLEPFLEKHWAPQKKGAQPV